MAGGVPGIQSDIVGQTAGGFSPNFGAFDTGGMSIGDLIPNSPTYLGAEAAATAAYQNALAQINQNRQSTLQQYGYKGVIDPNSGTITNMATDPNNQFGEYQSMLNTHATDQMSARANAATRGLGVGGLAAQGITADHRSFGADSAQLGANLMNALMGFQTQQNSAQTTMDNSLWQAELLAAQQAIMDQMFNTAPPGGGGDQAPTGTGKSAFGSMDPAIATAILSHGGTIPTDTPPKPTTKKPSNAGGRKGVQ